MADELPRLSTVEALILDLLADQHEMYGLELVEESGGRVKRGSVYVTLSRMEAKGYVNSRQEEKTSGAIGLPRRVYRMTATGGRVRDAWALARHVLAWGKA
jgi:PadR family transcriptional regulator, regulatory protein PadR